MKKTPTVLLLALTTTVACWTAAGGDPSPATATLALAAPGGVIKGTLSFEFRTPARLYSSKRWGVSRTMNTWLRVEFEARDGSTFKLVPRGAMPKWPHEDEVRQFEPGDKLVVDLSTGPSADYSIVSPTGDALDRLPPGEYRAKASLSVPDDPAVRRCRLSILDVAAPPLNLVVE